MFYSFAKAVIAFLFKILYRPNFINTDNIPNEGSVIFAGNHVHAFDPVLVAMSTKRHIRFFSKIELVKGPFGFFFKLLNVIPVDRSKKNPNAMADAIKSLNDKEAVCLFPEGTRNRTDKLLLDFKFGAVSMTQKSGATLVPFAIKGKYKMFKNDLRIVIGKPFKIDESENLEDANNKLKKCVEKILKDKSC